MLRLCLLFAVIAAATFDDYDDGEPSLLKCNWAQAYDDFNELLNCAELQDEVMLLASHWEGRFAAMTQLSVIGSLTLDAAVDHDSGQVVRHAYLLKLRYARNNLDQQILITGFN
jgi:hypothetical protein